MTMSLAAPVLDCLDPAPMVCFYAAACGAEVIEVDADGGYLRLGAVLLAVRRLDDYRPPSWPDPAVPVQVHLDFFVDDVADAEHRFVQLGATRPTHQPNRGNGLVVLLDPAGHPFCIGTREGVREDLLDH